MRAEICGLRAKIISAQLGEVIIETPALVTPYLRETYGLGEVEFVSGYWSSGMYNDVQKVHDGSP